MNPYVDPTTQREIEEFHRLLRKRADFYREALVVLAADRVLQDLEVVYVPKKPHRPVLLARHLVGRVGHWLLRKILHFRFGNDRRDRPKPTIVVIRSTATADRLFPFGFTYSDFYPDRDDPPADDW